MKYLNRSFSSRAATPEYRSNHAATFGEQRRKCGWCSGLGVIGPRAAEYVAMNARAAGMAEGPELDALRDEMDGVWRGCEPCPKGCEPPRPSRGRR